MSTLEPFIRWACTYDDTITSVIFGPLYNLVNIDNSVGFVIAWGIAALYYFLLYYKLELRFWNSVDGYIDARRSALFAILLYYLTSALLIGLTHGPLCAQKKILVRKWARGTIYPPAWLRDSLEQEASQ
jgi:hypothetical protein